MDRKFFSSTKRGEVQELKDELHSLDRQVKKNAVKKVIANMTVGKDVSTLFPDVVQCMQTDSIELKKLVYLYVMSYAKTQPEIAVLAVNTFRKDASDPNPLIRALAVRTMGCIRLNQILEYLLEPLRRCCQDTDPYVRKTAATCVAKVWDMNPEAVEDQGFIEILQDMMEDSNPMVASNAVASLTEIKETSGRSDIFDLDESTISKLLTALNECTEWGQVAILDAIASIEDDNAIASKTAHTIIERITSRLSHANQAVVLSAIRVIVKMIDRLIAKDDSASFISSVLKKITPPLISLLASEGPEIQYVSLRCMNLIIQKFPEMLSGNVKVFFTKYTDPIYIKLEKLEILIMLVSLSNVDQVLMELREYATEVDVEFVRRTVRGIGRIAIKLNNSDAAAKCISILLSLIEMKTNYVVQEAVVVARDIFRKYPTDYELIISALCENLESLDQPDAKGSMIWILGEYADRIEGVHEILGSFLEFFPDEPAFVQTQLLTASVKLYLKSPSTGQDVVTRALQLATEQNDNPDIRDRAYIYWRMLSSDPQSTKTIVTARKPNLVYDPTTAIAPQTLEILIGELSLVSSIVHREDKKFLRETIPTDDSVDYSDSPVHADSSSNNGDGYAEKIETIKANIERGASETQFPTNAEFSNDLLDTSPVGGEAPQQSSGGALIDLL
jgi:AP-1 complex subunit beta-1